MAKCCSNLFTEFTFQDLTNAKPPSEKASPQEMIDKTKQLISAISWDLVVEFIISCIKRLNNIGNCPIIS